MQISTGNGQFDDNNAARYSKRSAVLHPVVSTSTYFWFRQPFDVKGIVCIPGSGEMLDDDFQTN